MKIQFNTDKTITGDERHQDYFMPLIAEKLKRFESHITRVEVHVSDQNGNKEGWNDILCTLEARMEGHQPIAVSNQADKLELAIFGATEKLKAALAHLLGRMKEH